jgi:hypothetical protein
MTQHLQGGNAVPGGYYLNASRWAVAPVARDGDPLPPGPGRWRRVPMPVAVALVPILGVTFLMFMPVAGFLVLGEWVGGKVRRLFARAASPDPKPSPDTKPSPDQKPSPDTKASPPAEHEQPPA